MKNLFTILLLVVLNNFAFSQTDTVTSLATMIKTNHNIALFNSIYDEGSPLSYDPTKVDELGAAFSLNYTNQGGTGFDGYPSGTIGGVNVGGNYTQGDSSKCGMPVQIQNLNSDLRIRWKTNQIDADDADDKWWATINVIFDGGAKNVKPVETDRDYDLVIQLERYEQDALEDKAKGNSSYWWFARKENDDIQPFTLHIDGNEYQWAIRYKFFNYPVGHNAEHKNNKVHIKFIPMDNTDVAPYIDHPLSTFVDSTKSYIKHLDLPTEELNLANQKVAEPSLWVKSISAGYEVYEGESTLENIHFYTVMDNQAPIAAQLKSVYNSNNNKIVVRWFNHTVDTIEYYAVYRSENGGAYTKVANEVRDTVYKDYDWASGSTYSYYITASDRSFHESSASNVKSATILSPSAIISNASNPINSTIRVYPNPASYQLNIEGAELEAGTFRIYSMSGQDVTNQTYLISKDAWKIAVDISRLEQGAYIVKTGTTSKKLMVGFK